MEREEFLDRIALALGRGRVREAPEQAACGVPEEYAAMPFPDRSPQGLIDCFEAATAALGAHCLLADGRVGAAAALERLLDDLAPNSCITWDRSEFDGWPIESVWDRRHALATGEAAKADGMDDARMRQASLAADVGITLADSAAANTGTLMLCCSANRPRSVSLLPAVHIVLLDEAQIVPRLGDSLSMIDAPNPPSSVNFISGPSRSGDIEGDLSVGVHGPAAVYIIVARRP